MRARTTRRGDAASAALRRDLREARRHRSNLRRANFRANRLARAVGSLRMAAGELEEAGEDATEVEQIMQATLNRLGEAIDEVNRLGGGSHTVEEYLG